MNNAFVDDKDELVIDTSVVLRERQTELTNLVTAINELAKNENWQVLKKLLFDGLVEKIDRQLTAEVKKNELNPTEIYRLQGQLVWAKRYSDLYKLAETYKLELNQITKKLNENAPIRTSRPYD